MAGAAARGVAYRASNGVARRASWRKRRRGSVAAVVGDGWRAAPHKTSAAASAHQARNIIGWRLACQRARRRRAANKRHAAASARQPRHRRYAANGTP